MITRIQVKELTFPYLEKKKNFQDFFLFLDTSTAVDLSNSAMIIILLGCYIFILG